MKKNLLDMILGHLSPKEEKTDLPFPSSNIPYHIPIFHLTAKNRIPRMIINVEDRMIDSGKPAYVEGKTYNAVIITKPYSTGGEYCWGTNADNNSLGLYESITRNLPINDDDWIHDNFTVKLSSVWADFVVSEGTDSAFNLYDAMKPFLPRKMLKGDKEVVANGTVVKDAMDYLKQIAPEGYTFDAHPDNRLKYGFFKIMRG